MGSGNEAEILLRQGKLAEALAKLEQQVRAEPAAAKHRVFLFQLLCVMGQWERALTQLNVAAEMDPANLLMAQVCREALQCEALRAEIFAGTRAPLIFGKPNAWVGLMVQANQLTAQGKIKESQKLRHQAFDAAPAVAGTISGKKFAWIADADQRLGPIFEAIIDGRYFWVPLENVKEIKVDKPADLRDLVWATAHFTWANGGEAVGLIPSRYPGSEASEDGAIRLGRRTDWVDKGSDLSLGLGQRVLATDQGEYPLLEADRITLECGDGVAAA